MIDMKNITEMRRKGFSSKDVSNSSVEKSIVDGLKSISADAVNHYPRISESLFKREYLPAFAGLLDDVSERYSIYLNWTMEIAGNYNMPVHVCDDKNKDIILFTVPGVSNVGTINPTKVKDYEINNIIKTAESAVMLKPMSWESELKDSLHDVLVKLFDKSNLMTNLDESQKEWFSIFQRYASVIKAHLDIKPKTEVSDEQPNKQKPQEDYNEVEEPL